MLTLPKCRMYENRKPTNGDFEHQDTATSGGGGAVAGAAKATAVDGPDMAPRLLSSLVQAPKMVNKSQEDNASAGPTQGSGSRGSQGTGGSSGNLNGASCSDEGSNEPGSTPDGPSQMPDASDLGMLGRLAAGDVHRSMDHRGAHRVGRAAVEGLTGGVASFSVVQPELNGCHGDVPQAQRQGRGGSGCSSAANQPEKHVCGVDGVQAAGPQRRGGPVSMGWIMGGTAKAAKEEADSLGPTDMDAPNGTGAQDEQPEAMDEDVIPHPVASTVAYVGELGGSSEHDTGVGSHGLGSNHGPRSGQGSNEADNNRRESGSDHNEGPEVPNGSGSGGSGGGGCEGSPLSGAKCAVSGGNQGDGPCIAT